MQAVVSLFKVLADPTRLRLATLFAIKKELCVCVLAEALDEPDFKISRHLGIMRAAGMVETRRKGQWVYYRLSQPRHRMEQRLQDCLKDCMADHKAIKADLKRLQQATCGKGGMKVV